MRLGCSPLLAEIMYLAHAAHAESFHGFAQIWIDKTQADSSLASQVWRGPNEQGQQWQDSLQLLAWQYTLDERTRQFDSIPSSRPWMSQTKACFTMGCWSAVLQMRLHYFIHFEVAHADVTPSDLLRWSFVLVSWKKLKNFKDTSELSTSESHQRHHTFEPLLPEWTCMSQLVNVQICLISFNFHSCHKFSHHSQICHVTVTSSNFSYLPMHDAVSTSILKRYVWALCHYASCRHAFG